VSDPTVRIAGLDVSGLGRSDAERLRLAIASRLAQALGALDVLHDVRVPGFAVEGDDLDAAADAVVARVVADLRARGAVGGAR
jgi:hypothetical protein